MYNQNYQQKRSYKENPRNSYSKGNRSRGFHKEEDLDDFGMVAFVEKAKQRAKWEKKHNYSKGGYKRGSGKPQYVPSLKEAW